MATRPPKACLRCGQTYPAGGRCPCAPARPTYQRHTLVTQGGYGTGHRNRFRPGVLARDPICVICGIRPSTRADHYPWGRDELVSSGRDPDDPQYGRGLCASCDSRQTAQRQPGGWNRRGPRPASPPPPTPNEGEGGSNV